MAVLYRKYRPHNFSEIVGRDHIKKTLKNAILMKMVSHAYLFYGQRGTGKTTIARLLAKAINCEKRKETEFEPCLKCQSCIEISKGNAMDLIEIDAASNRGIDQIRDLKEGINIVPTRSKYKVYIIDECHMLTKEASNALLKTLEEPPGHVIFVLCTTEYAKVIPTISSRCQRFEFKKINLRQIVDKLSLICKKEKVKAQIEALELISQNADGSFRDAESLLDEVINAEDKEITKNEVEDILGIVGVVPISQMVDFLAKKDKKETLEHIGKIMESGMDIENFSKKLISYLHDLLLIKINPDLLGKGEIIFTKEEIDNLKNQEKYFSESQLKNMIKKFILACQQIKLSNFPQLSIEIAAIEAIDALNKETE